MLAAAEAIAGYVARGRDAFDKDAAVRDAIVYQIAILGEAAKAVAEMDSTVEAGLGIELSPVARMRDKVMHHYWAVDRQVV